MNLKVGIVGLPNVGKSTLFHALTQKEVHIANYPFATIDPNVGVVPVPDLRLEALAKVSRSQKVIPAVVEFVDIAGLVKGASGGLGLGNTFLSHIKDVDAILHVVRVFQNSDVVHVDAIPDPLRDMATVQLELVLKDLETTEKARERAESEARSGDAKKMQRRDTLQSIKSRLEKEEFLSHLPLTEEERTVAREMGLLTAKPMVVVFNISDQELKDSWKPIDGLLDALKNTPYLAIPVGIEDEARKLSHAEGEEFRALAGVAESLLDQLIQKCYGALDLISFFTTGEDETRSWTIPSGSMAPRAGRAIHSDFEEKFIRAEIIPWKKLVEAGSWAKAKELGWIRTEGKAYTVQDGDVIEFRI
ncbi:MAG: redox-regulated ATPase YchF [Candidatus Sungbacteria bacterium]|nr:redox-regulated ATPase YchF [Candidatus Sungbacteria bacterium]